MASAADRSTAAALEAIGVGIGLDGTMDVLDSSRREADRSTHRDDLAALAAVAALHPEAATFEHWLRDVLTRPPAEGPAVLLSTVHRIKGKEWDRVIVFGATQGLLPHRLGDDEEGERRVFHVALTRARRQVAVLADAEAPSIFLGELDGSRPRPEPDGAPPVPTVPVTADGTSRGGERRARSGPGDRRAARRSLPSVAAEPGLTIEYRGQTVQVLEVGADGVVVGVAGGPRGGALRYRRPCRGQDVEPASSRGRALRAAAQAAEAALREWRSAVAKQDAVPAYVVLNDKELVGIASELPRTLPELASCRGIGPLRLEKWGDEILAVLESATTG